MISTILFIGFIVGISILGIYVPITLAERSTKRTCPGCQDGTVLFAERGLGLCHKHWERWDRINQLEQKLDYEWRLALERTEQDARAEALDILLGKLERSEGYPVSMKIAGEWVQIGYLPEKPDGSR